jgi:aryl-alcohol dehydrogenase
LHRAGAVLNALEAKAGNSIAIFGLGAIGQSAIMAAKIAGCYPIVAVDLVDDKLEAAKSVGATHVINSKNTEDVVAEIRKLPTAAQNIP